MALETRIEEVENDAEEEMLTQYMSIFGWKLKSSQLIFNRTSTPVGAISYENLTYIQSKTDTVDFRRLVFERDTRIPHYKKILELEEEFWLLAEAKTAERPHEPNPPISFQEWVKTSKPQTTSRGEKIVTFICSFPVCCILVGACALLWASSQGVDIQSTSSEDIAQVFVLTSIPFATPLSLIFTTFFSHVKSFISLRNPNSKGYQKARQAYHKYEIAYENQLEAIRIYDHAVTRIPQILTEANNLLE